MFGKSMISNRKKKLINFLIFLGEKKHYYDELKALKLTGKMVFQKSKEKVKKEFDEKGTKMKYNPLNFIRSWWKKTIKIPMTN